MKAHVITIRDGHLPVIVCMTSIESEQLAF